MLLLLENIKGTMFLSSTAQDDICKMYRLKLLCSFSQFDLDWRFTRFCLFFQSYASFSDRAVTKT